MESETGGKTQEQSFFAALAELQGELDPAIKDMTNPHLGNRYADLASCWEALKKVLPKHGFCVMQMGTLSPDNKPLLRTVLAHRGGYAISSEIPIMLAENRGLNIMQTFGSAWTYARRYGLAAITGLTAEDTDGEPPRTSHTDGAPEPQRAQTPPPKEPGQDKEPVTSQDVDTIERLVKLAKEQGVTMLGKKGFDSDMMGKWIAAMRRGKDYPTWQIANLVRDLKAAVKEEPLKEMFGDDAPDPMDVWWADFLAADGDSRLAMLSALAKYRNITEAKFNVLLHKHTAQGQTGNALENVARELWGA